MCSHKYWFNTFEPIRNTGPVRGFDGSECKIEGVDTICFKMFDIMIRSLTDVVYIPTMKRNPISLSVFDDKGYKYSGGGGVLKISKGSQVVIKADLRKTNGLYYVRGTTITGCSKPLYSTPSPIILHYNPKRVTFNNLVLTKKFRPPNLNFVRICLVFQSKFLGAFEHYMFLIFS